MLQIISALHHNWHRWQNPLRDSKGGRGGLLLSCNRPGHQLLEGASMSRGYSGWGHVPSLCAFMFARYLLKGTTVGGNFQLYSCFGSFQGFAYSQERAVRIHTTLLLQGGKATVLCWSLNQTGTSRDREIDIHLPSPRSSCSGQCCDLPFLAALGALAVHCEEPLG